MLNFEQISVAYKLIELIKNDDTLVASTETFGDWLHHLEDHLFYSLED